MLRFACGLWIGCGRFVDTKLRIEGFTHNSLAPRVMAGYRFGVFTQFFTCITSVSIHRLKACFTSVILGFSSFSTPLIITTSWYKNNFFISSLCGKVAI